MGGSTFSSSACFASFLEDPVVDDVDDVDVNVRVVVAALSVTTFGSGRSEDNESWATGRLEGGEGLVAWRRKCFRAMLGPRVASEGWSGLLLAEAVVLEGTIPSNSLEEANGSISGICVGVTGVESASMGTVSVETLAGLRLRFLLGRGSAGPWGTPLRLGGR